MAKRRHHKGTLRRVEEVRELTEQHFEPGNQARCYKAVWRRWVNPRFPMCYRTYLNYLSMPPEPPTAEPKDKQPGLFDAIEESQAD